MNKRLEDYLWKRFDAMLPERTFVTPQNSCMYWGFAVGEGWYNLLKQTLILAEQLIKAYPDNGAGFQIAQVKEKFGCLRIYFDGWIPLEANPSKDPMWKIFIDAENKSATICEVCGKPGKRNKGPWVKTVCEFHDKTYADRNRRYREKSLKALKAKRQQ